MIILFVMCVICLFGWLVSYNSARALLLYMRDKGYEPPNKTEAREYAIRAARDLFGLEKEEF